MSTTTRDKVRAGLLAGLRTGWRGFVWICEIVLPVSLALTLLQWSGWISYLDAVLQPVMGLLRLPPEAALPLLSGMLINIYAAIAALSVIPFTIPQMTLIATFCLVAHNLIIEGVIQHKSGINIAATTAIRIGAAIVTVLAVGLFFPDTARSVSAAVAALERGPLPDVLVRWAIDTGLLLLKVVGIIMGIMVLLQLAKSLGWLDRILKVLGRFMRALGLAETTAMMWVAAQVFGLMYGGAVIVEEAAKGTIKKHELEPLHIFIGINHSMVEDPLLFAVLGINILWLWIPRFITALVAVQAYRGVLRLRAAVWRG